VVVVLATSLVFLKIEFLFHCCTYSKCMFLQAKVVPFKAMQHVERSDESKALHFCRFLSADKSTLQKSNVR
jgi:hypothetical protein